MTRRAATPTVPRRRHAPRADGMVARWALTITDTCYAPMSGAAVRSLLQDMADRLAETLLAEPFDAAPARQIGADLVAAHFTGGETLGRTVEVLATGLLAELDTPHPDGAHLDGPDPRGSHLDRPRLDRHDPDRSDPDRPGPRRPRLDRSDPDRFADRYADRLPRLLGALAEGFTQAQWEHTVDAQEQIAAAIVDARAEAERALQASEARFRAVYAGSAIGIGIADMTGRLVDANPALVEMTGYPLDELCRRAITDFVHPADVATTIGLFAELANRDRHRFRTDQRLRRRDGQVLWAHLAASLILDHDGAARYQVVMIEDVTDRHHLQLRLRHQALHDPLTGLPNRTLFFDRLHEVFAAATEGTRIGVCYLDLDGFKMVNDRLGHETGDELLMAVANRLYECVSRAGHLVARMGGDEFVILVDNHTCPAEVIALADEILAVLDPPIRVGGHRLSVSASVGIIERLVEGTTAADVMRAADMTLYWAKSDGKRRWVMFDPDRSAAEMARYELSASMPEALERNEFVLHYQPLVELAGGTVVGVEALARWNHPDLGLLAPDRFIGLAEETGMIVPLGRWVLETACEQARGWQHPATGAAPLISVNLAVQQAQDPGLVADVASILDRTGLPPDRLQLELTESAVMAPGQEPLAALTTLSAMGVRIAIDDFGTGYSNLAYLRSLPVHSLKLAGPFVDGLRTDAGSDPVGERIVANLVQLAHAIGLTVTAEGVETEAQATRLRAMSCDSGQGMYFASPVPPDQLTNLLT